MPGIDFSNDPLLQGRLFSYLDTQLSRLGSANFHQLPINAPKCPFANHQRDGHMQMPQPMGRVAYEPNSLVCRTRRAKRPAGGFRSAAVAKRARKAASVPRASPITTARRGSSIRSQTAHEQAHMASALVFELSKVEHAHIREAMVGHLRQHRRGSRSARRRRSCAGHSLPTAAGAGGADQKAALRRCRLIGKMKDTLEGRAIAILVADGSDGALIKTMKKAATDAGATVKIVAPKVGGAKLADGSMLAADGQLAGTPSVLFDAVAVILSDDGAAALSKESAAIDFVRDAFGHLKAIAIDNGGQTLLQKAGVAPDGGVVSAHDSGAFIAVAKRRQWSREPGVRTLA